MKSKAIIPMLVGVGIGLLALKMGWDYVEKSRVSAAASQGDTTVVVAKLAVGPGTQLQLSDLKTANWPRSAVPANAHSDPKELVGRVSQMSLSAELPILENMLAPPGTTPGLQGTIPPGYQAMSVKVDEFAGVAGFLKPGNKVDVVATFNVKRSKSEPTETVTRTILRDITVSAVGQEKQASGDNKAVIVRSVTLLVRPRQAQWLSLASTRGTISLAMRSGQSPGSTSTLPAIDFGQLLRGESDKQTGSEGGQAKSWIAGLFKPKTVSPAAVVSKPVKVDPHWKVKIFRGLKGEEIIFENVNSSRRIEPGSPEEKSQGVSADHQEYQKLENQDKTQTFEYVENEFFGEQEAVE